MTHTKPAPPPPENAEPLTRVGERTPAQMRAYARHLTGDAEAAKEDGKAVEAAHFFLRADLWYTTAQVCMRMDEIVTNQNDILEGCT